MSWLGKLVGGGLGMMFGGPLGAIIGAGLGHAFVDAGPRISGSARFSTGETRQAAFFATTFAMLGKMAKADGQVSSEEIAVVDRFMDDQLKLRGDARKLAISIFNEAKNNNTPFIDYARQFGQLFGHDPALRLMLYQLLFAVAVADGSLHPAEDALLQEALGPLGVDASAYDRLTGGGRSSGSGRVSRSPSDLAAHYAVLGVSPDVTDEELKKVYRQAAREFHPDKVISQGLPEEFGAFAEEKFKEINVAYDAITEHRRAAN